MPRHINPDVEKKVLDAARKLWDKGGEKALTIRSVAKAAGTNPPALYRRFPTREAILKALVEAYQMEFLKEVESSESLLEFATHALDVALIRPRDFELFSLSMRRGFVESRPVAELFMQRCAKLLGGAQEDHANLAMLISALVRGTVTQLMDDYQLAPNIAQTKAAFKCAAQVLIANERKLRLTEQKK